MDQRKLERDVVIGDDVLFVAGAEIGDGCINRRRLGRHGVDPRRFDRGREPGARRRPQGDWRAEAAVREAQVLANASGAE
jgi:hypothetical protein